MADEVTYWFSIDLEADPVVDYVETAMYFESIGWNDWEEVLNPYIGSNWDVFEDVYFQQKIERSYKAKTSSCGWHWLAVNFSFMDTYFRVYSAVNLCKS